MRRQLVVVALVLAAIAGGLAPQTRGPFGGDEFYIMANLGSKDWGDRWFAFNASFPGQSGGAWYDGVAPYERRYVRLAPSALMSVEATIFGSSAASFKLVSLLLHLMNCLLGLRLLARWLGFEKAAALTAIVGLHPIVAQPVSWVACQPILVAMLATLLAATALERRLAGRGALASFAVVACAFLAVTSYEAAVAVPLGLLAFDAWAVRRGSAAPSRPMQAALIALYPVYGAIVAWNLSDVGLTDASYRATLPEFLSLATADLANYLAKTFSGARLDHRSAEYARLGHPLALATMLGLLALLVWRRRSRPGLTVGLLTYAALLAPPLLTRAAVSFTNLPSHRQLYLPLLGVAIALGSLWSGPIRRWQIACVVVVCGAFALLCWQHAPNVKLAAAHAAMGAAVQRELADSPDDAPLVVIGESRCGYDPRFDAPGRIVRNLIPLTIPGDIPEILRLDSHTLQASSSRGLRVVRFAPTRPRPGDRKPHEIAGLARDGRQELGLAVAEAAPPDGRAPYTEIRFRFERPLTSHVFLSIHGCELPTRVELP